MKLLNHCGAQSVTIEDMMDMDDPRPMSLTHVPIRHDAFTTMVRGRLGEAGYNIKSEEYSLHRIIDRHKSRVTTDNLFGVMEITNCNNHKEVGRLVGIRNSSTMHFKAQLGCGNRVFVCDNLSFSANIVVGRRHTIHILRDLPEIITQAVDKMNAEFVKSEERIEAYKSFRLDQKDVHDIMMKSLDKEAIPSSLLRVWINTYRNPSNEDFRREDCWALQNSFTEVAKRWNFPVMQDRTNKLINVMDKFVGLGLNQESVTLS
jgi:hypothetical protein